MGRSSWRLALSAVLLLNVVCGPFSQEPARADKPVDPVGGGRRADQNGDPLPDGAVRRLGKYPEHNQFRAFQFSPDGKTLTVLGALSVSFWPLPDGKPVHWTVPEKYVHSMAVSPDGRTVVTVHTLQGIFSWDVETGRKLHTFRGPPADRNKNETSHVAISPDGRTLAASGPDGVQFWELATAKDLPERQTKGADKPAGDVRFSPDGKLVFGTIPGEGVHCWEAATGKRLQVFKEEGRVGYYSIAFSLDGRLVACITTAVKDKTTRITRVLVWEAASGNKVLEVEKKPDVDPLDKGDRFENVALSADGQLLAVGGSRSQVGSVIWLWDVTTGKQLRPFEVKEGYSAAVMAFAPDGKTLVGGSGQSILFWDLTKVRGRPSKAPELTAEALDRLWADLAGSDVASARKALFTLAAAPKQAVPLFGERLKPIPRAEAKEMAALVADLDSPNFATRDAASARLELLVYAAEPALRRALADKPSAELRKRIEPLLKHLEWPITSPDRLRRLRAIEALEAIGDAEAQKVLCQIADGAPGFPETDDAKAALERLAQRKP